MNDDLKNLQDTLTRIREMASDLKKSVAVEQRNQKDEQKEWDEEENNLVLEDQDKLAQVKVKFNKRYVIDQYFP